MSENSIFSDDLGSSGSEYEDYILEESDFEDNINDQIEINNEDLKSKSGIMWSYLKPNKTKTSAENILSCRPGPLFYATQRIINLLDCFLVYFNTEILNKIIFCTNLFGEYYFGDKWKDVDETELKAYIGLLILMGVHKDREEPLCELFSAQEGKEIYRKLFKFQRYKEITRAIHFDDYRTRELRRQHDKFCPIRDIWNMWVDILPRCFSPNQDVTVDEQLVSFRGKCPFKQYMPMKPAKYGIKYFLLVDPYSYYVVNISIYLGKNGFQTSNQCNVGETVVLNLAAPIFFSGRNVVADNFFSSFSLATKLLQKKLTYLGTLRKNKKEIPNCLLPSSKRALYSSVFVYYEKFMMISYVPKKSKSVILLTSGTTDNSISDGLFKHKPNIILNYNETKGGVDNVDRMLASVSARRFTRRWPLLVFYNMIDLSLINAYSLYKDIFNSKIKRRSFLKEIAKQLYSPFLEKNCENQPKIVLKKRKLQPNQPDIIIRQSRCEYCERKKDRKASKCCKNCYKYYCPNHSSNICFNCIK